MMQTINPYATARTAEIMSRYRPIAPKPEAPTTNSMAENENSGVPNGIRKSPYLRNVWAHLQARPTRTRKRGRTAAFSPPSVKRARTCLQGLSPPYQVTNSPAKNLAMHGFTHTANGLPQISLVPNLVPLKCGLDTAVTTLAESHPIIDKGKESCCKGIDLNMTAADQGPEELDLLPQLQEPVKPRIISPRPVRPVGSSITVKSITDDPGRQTVAKGPEEVEEAVEAEAVPAIVSDSNNKVRMSNSAYKELVGQPECGWLDCANGKNYSSGGGGACKRIGGEVSLQFVDSKLQQSMHGFSCRVKIEWESEGKKNSVNASCNAVKLACQAKDYQFLWRFQTSEAWKSASDN
ncbi:hypothetical protein Pfo_016807 [Paulownia fortunei]|nr:hypothetical protein Pfo_016807 [Paulownia fortunei]